MKHIEIGSFEAKTHFSQLLLQVEQGTVIHITRRGKPVAVLMREKSDRDEVGQKAMGRIRSRRNTLCKKAAVSIDDILSFRDEGRK